jgi:hypothetical protein
VSGLERICGEREQGSYGVIQERNREDMKYISSPCFLCDLCASVVKVFTFGFRTHWENENC